MAGTAEERRSNTMSTMDRIKDVLWETWIPTWEGENNPWLKFRATVMYWVRSCWYLGRKENCRCSSKCKNMIPKASAATLCQECASAECACFDDYERIPSNAGQPANKGEE